MFQDKAVFFAHALVLKTKNKFSLPTYVFDDIPWCVVAERIRALDSSSGVSDQQSVGSSPGRDTCVLKQDT